MKTSKMATVLLVAVVSALFAAQSVTAQIKTSAADDSSLLGDWRGDSICVVRESACHDEDSLYHVTKIAGKPGWVSLKLDKIVDGKPVTMGTTDCTYDAAKRLLTCQFPRGAFHFSVQLDKMIGTMHLTDGTLWRKISLKKATP
jgi:hypothetical protein